MEKVAIFGITLLIAGGAFLQDTISGRKQDNRANQGAGRSREYPFPTKAWSEGSVLLGNATDKSVEIAIRFKSDVEAVIEYGLSGEDLNQKSETLNPRHGPMNALPSHPMFRG
jgi:hypothetical protein